jgi:hypothetical protein
MNPNSLYSKRAVIAALGILAGVSMCGALVAQFGEACLMAPPGGGNRSEDCLWAPGTGCTQADPPCSSGCQVDPTHYYACVSCNGGTEATYQYCATHPDTNCTTTNPSVTCLTYTCFYDSGNCSGLNCFATNDDGIACTSN